MGAFIEEGIIAYFDRFKTDMDCLAYLAEIKNKNAYKCFKCGHDKFTIRKKNFATDCTRCHHIESPTAGTMFHKVKFGMRKAFSIIFEISATTKSRSARQIAKRYEISYPAA